MQKKIRKRQTWNYKVLELIKEQYSILNDDIKELISKYPEQRFGQIICNYICPDYRSDPPSHNTEIWLRTDIFPDNMDFFYEEPWETFTRLKS